MSQIKLVVKKINSEFTADLIDKLKSIESSVLSVSELVMFKVCPELVSAIEKDVKSREQIVERSANTPVYLTLFDNESYKHIIYRILKDEVIKLDDLVLLEKIRTYDLLEIVHMSKGDCIIDAPDGIHFVTPSNMHTTRFFRVADALHSYNSLDRISFWLQPYMENISGVLIDSWSLSSIFLQTQNILNLKNVPFDSFEQHVAHDERGAIRTLKKLDSKIHGDGKILVIVSVTSSGFFFRRLKSLLEQSEIDREIDFITIYKLNNSNSDINSLSTLDLDMEAYDASECVYCKGEERKTKHVIHPKFYYPRENIENIKKFKSGYLNDISSKSFFGFKWKSKVKSSGVNFVNLYGLLPGALCVHRDDPNDGVNPRHHAFYIDVCILLENEKFLDEFYKKLIEINKKGSVEVFIIPEHSAGIKIKSVIEEKYGANVILSDDLTNLSSSEKTYLSLATHICIIDDVVITGSRLDQYVKTLRDELREYTKSIVNITWFPLIARPDTNKTIETLKVDKLCMHGWNDELVYLYNVILPNWSSIDCPWCHELDILSSKSDVSFGELSCVEKRKSILFYNKDQGLIDDSLFLLPSIERESLASNSPLANENSTDIMLLFIISIGLQNFRNKTISPLGRNIHQSVVLSVNETFERYSESLIQAALLRVVKIDEWNTDSVDAGLEFINRQSIKGDNGNIFGELITFLHRLGYMKNIPNKMYEKILLLDDDMKSISTLLDRFHM